MVLSAYYEEVVWFTGLRLTKYEVRGGLKFGILNSAAPLGTPKKVKTFQGHSKWHPQKLGNQKGPGQRSIRFQTEHPKEVPRAEWRGIHGVGHEVDPVL